MMTEFPFLDEQSLQDTQRSDADGSQNHNCVIIVCWTYYKKQNKKINSVSYMNYNGGEGGGGVYVPTNVESKPTPL